MNNIAISDFPGFQGMYPEMREAYPEIRVSKFTKLRYPDNNYLEKSGMQFLVSLKQ